MQTQRYIENTLEGWRRSTNRNWEEMGSIREGSLEEEHSTLAGMDYGVKEGFLEERTGDPEL